MRDVSPVGFGSLVSTASGVVGVVWSTREWHGELLVGVEPVGQPGVTVWAQHFEVAPLSLGNFALAA